MLLSKPSDKKIYFVEGNFPFFSSIESSYACGLLQLAVEFLIYRARSGIVIDIQILVRKMKSQCSVI